MSQSSPKRNTILNQEFCSTLPLDIMVDILSRLPVRTIISCKCVCKSWLSLINTHEFAKFHFSKSVPLLALSHDRGRYSKSHAFNFFEVEDGLDLEHVELHFNPVTKFNLPYRGWIHGSANGLLSLCDNYFTEVLYICNPITRDYIELRCPPKFVTTDGVIYGFGVSKITSQLKVVRIFQEWTINNKFECQCHVYTLGIGSWRRITHATPLKYGHEDRSGAFLNGNLHWLVVDLSGNSWISCFDLETELFSTFSTPTFSSHGVGLVDMLDNVVVVALEDYLCVCDADGDDIEIWLMKEYGVEKSWTKEFVIRQFNTYRKNCHSIYYRLVNPIKVFNNGDILLAWENDSLLYYSKKNQIARRIDTFEELKFINAILHTPSLLSLKSFGVENVRSLPFLME